MDWTPVLDWLASHGVRILIILLVGAALYFAVRKLVPRVVVHTVQRRMAKKLTEEVEKRTKTLSRALVWIGTVLIVVVVAFMILSEVGIDITPLLAGAGIVGIALGFGAQYLIRDLIAGLFVIIEDQYDVGDVVKLGDVSGIVEEINLRRTVLRDLDGIMHIIPNGQSAVASNYTRDWSRVNLNVSVAYGTDLDHAIAVINRVCAEMVEEPYWGEAILKTPQVLRVDKLGDSGIEIKILGDTRPIKQWDVMGEIRKRLKKAFDEEGIEIPWPHTKVYFGNVPPWGMPGEAETAPSAPSQALPPDED